MNRRRLAQPVSRRRVRGFRAGAVAALVLCAAALGSPFAHAGAQQYIPMSAAVRGALSAAVTSDRSAPEPQFTTIQEKVDWLASMSDRLPRRWKPDYQTRIEFLKTVRYEAGRAGLDVYHDAYAYGMVSVAIFVALAFLLGVVDLASRRRARAH